MQTNHQAHASTPIDFDMTKDWSLELIRLVQRYSSLGLGADLNCMASADRYGLYLRLQRIEQSEKASD